MAYATRTLNVNTEIYNPEYCTKASGNCIILNYENGVYKTGEDLSGTILTNLGHSGLLRCTQAIVFQEEEENLLHHSSHMYICTYVPTYLPIPNFCYSTTGHDHDRPGALRPMHASPTQPHTYKLPAASVDYIPTCSRPLIEFPTVSNKKAVRTNH